MCTYPLYTANIPSVLIIFARACKEVLCSLMALPTPNQCINVINV